MCFRTGLHWASRRGHDGVIRVLLEHGADPGIVDKNGRTASDVANDVRIGALIGRRHYHIYWISACTIGDDILAHFSRGVVGEK